MSTFHPSTSTKSISLNGNEMSTGGSITMPIEVKTDATTMSSTRNGTYTRKPISNAVFSSEIRNAGISTCGATSSGTDGRAAPAASTKSARSFSRVWRSMNWRSGS